MSMRSTGPALLLSNLALFACAPSPPAASETTASALESSSTITPAELAKAVSGENDWVPYGTCSLTLDTSGADVVVTLTAYTQTGSLRVPADAAITFTESDD